MATYYYATGGTAANKAAATTGTYPGGCILPLLLLVVDAIPWRLCSR